MNTRKLLALAGLLLLTACSPAENAAENAMEDAIEQETGGNANVDLDGDAMRIETDEGVFTTEKNLPGDWPTDVAVYPGAEIQFSAAMNDDGAGALFLSDDSVEDVIGFYKKELEEGGWTISATMENAGSSFMGATKDNRVVSIAAALAEGRTSITIGIGQQ